MDHKMQNFMRQNQQRAPRQFERKVNPTDALIAEMFLEKSLIDFKIAKIKKEIDVSLAERNKEEFHRLVKELESLT
ncbi:IDEAL domain-containing protein [Neobacillus sp. LXY-4]|uniref:IDEAL domain-containing protein n=1 Tax=Neobacillus sp. LXY-4 TaxID=3379826 RepID=UPI003EE3EC13